MGEHGTWFDYLGRLPFWQALTAKAEHALGRTWQLTPFEETHFTLNHVVAALLLVAFILFGALVFKSRLAGGKGLVPERKMTFGNFFEMMADAAYGMVEEALGKKAAPRYFPLIAAFWFFILLGNLMSLIPGFMTPNETLKTNVMLAGIVFFATHFYGVREHGLPYFKHFLGPSLVLAPLMLPVEIISHLARPLSLSLRLMGNMIADHKVLMTFFGLVPFLVPLPFYLLGMFICLVQSIVFCSLALVYFGMAIEHEEH